METFSSHSAFVGWNGDPEPFFLAAEAAIEAGPYEPVHQQVSLRWEDRDGTYESIEKARARLRRGPLPTVAEVEVGQLAEGGLATDTSPARLHIQVLGGVVTIIGAGREWDKASRAYQAAVVAYERALPEPEPEPNVVELQAASTSHEHAASSDRTKRRRIRISLATLVSLMTLATGVLTFKDSLFGGVEGARTAPGQSQQTTGKIPRFDGVAGHLSQSRALLSFLDQHDNETVYLEVGFPDLLSGPLGGGNVVVDDVREKSGTKLLVKQVSLMTKCDPPANKEDPTPADGCQGTSLAIRGAENDDSGTFFQHGVPVIKGYFTVDVTGGLHMGLSPIFLRPLTFAQATGS